MGARREEAEGGGERARGEVELAPRSVPAAGGFASLAPPLAGQSGGFAGRRACCPLLSSRASVSAYAVAQKYYTVGPG